ncbi:MAG: winged helix-turn-helix transcriptional regulator [Candidatus Diapherotrites archaeon]|uniref:Winged helix-turn-helix transcriptional regulator n=1 Tax=Candidatus Iainarchaeum sp. TaxID=3101447 RepID=A0A8T4L622_9ARCH|nr:winged helix-turn-helix transcriptional regulator [Candidatus Diapherotrites archaeon]
MKEISLDKDTFKALAGETRVQILKELNERRKTQSELAQKLGLSPPTVNEHIELLKKAGLVESKDEGRKWKYYALTGKGKDLLNPGDSKIMLMLGISSMALVGTGIYLFSRFFSENTFSAPLQTNATDVSDKVMGTTMVPVIERATTEIPATVSRLPGFESYELALLTILAICAGLLFGIYWARRTK